jgi:hypothetical protein
VPELRDGAGPPVRREQRCGPRDERADVRERHVQAIDAGVVRPEAVEQGPPPVIDGTSVLGWGLNLGRLRARDGLAVRPAGPGQTRVGVGHGQAERPSKAGHRSSPEVIVTRQGPDR